MAASTAFTVAAGSATSIEFSALSSKSAFGSSCNVVQGAPIARPAVRAGAIRASSSNNSEEARPARREVLAGILAAGAALGFTNQAKADALGDAQNLADEAGSGIKRRLDGLFGKNKPYPQRNTQVTGKGPIADAKNRVSNFLDNSKNPVADGVEKLTEEAEAKKYTAFGSNSASELAKKEFLGDDSARVDEATARVNAGAEKLQGKAVQAFDDAKGAAKTAVSAAKDATPDTPSLPSLPSVNAPNPSGLFNALGSKVEGAKSDITSKADDAKSLLPGQ